jgi:cytochrome P450
MSTTGWRAWHSGQMPEHTTLVSALMDSNLPTSEKTLRRLEAEVSSIFGAGVLVPSEVLTFITIRLLCDQVLRDRLDRELRHAAAPGTSVWQTLDTLPYLQAVLLETFRMVHGCARRLQREAPDDDLHYTGQWTPPNKSSPVKVQYVIPRGSSIGMSALLVHNNEELFPRAGEFRPERWLNREGKLDKRLQQYLLTFSKGSRQCVGTK